MFEIIIIVSISIILLVTIANLKKDDNKIKFDLLKDR
jgi:competence protein ComGC